MQYGFITDGGELKAVTNPDRFSHIYVIGRAKMGKSRALKCWALDDICEGDSGIVYFDFTGRDVEELMCYIPPHRRDDCVLFAPADREFPVAFNPLDGVKPDQRDQRANEIYNSFKDIYYPEGNSTPNVELYMMTTLYALLDVPDSTLMGIYYMLASETYRKRVVGQLKNKVVESFWTDFYTAIPEKETRRDTQSTLNKMFSLIVDDTVKNVIGQVDNKLDFKAITDNRQILLVSLPQGQLGREKARLLGTLVLSQLYAALLSREDGPPFHIYLDNVHRFGARTVIEMLDGLDGQNASLTMAHRYTHQLTDELQEAILGTVGSLVSFRLGVTDAERLDPEYPRDNTQKALTELRANVAHVKTPEATYYSVEMLGHDYHHYPDGPKKIQAWSRRNYAVKRENVKARIDRFVEGT